MSRIRRLRLGLRLAVAFIIVLGALLTTAVVGARSLKALNVKSADSPIGRDIKAQRSVAEVAEHVHETSHQVVRLLYVYDGDLAPLAELLQLAERYDCLLLLDEAHATGVLGSRGRGLTDLVPALEHDWPQRLIKVGTLSKALGSQGGFVCGPRVLADWLVNHARPYVFSMALAPPAASAARRAVALVAGEPQRRRHLLDLAELLRSRLRDAGRRICSSRSTAARRR